MRKKYIVRLTQEERSELREVIKKLKGTGQKARVGRNSSAYCAAG